MANNRRVITGGPDVLEQAAKKVTAVANDFLNDCLNDFKVIMGQVDGCWESQGSVELKQKFDTLKPDFDKFYSYLNKVVKFLNQNVAADAETLDSTIKNNAVALQSRT